MATQSDLDKVRSRIVRHGTFSYIARLNLERCQAAQERLDFLRNTPSSHPSGTALSKEEEQELLALTMPVLYEVDRTAIVAIVFSAMALEAFIFDYGVAHFSKSYVENYLDKLDLVAKSLSENS